MTRGGRRCMEGKKREKGRKKKQLLTQELENKITEHFVIDGNNDRKKGTKEIET